MQILNHILEGCFMKIYDQTDLWFKIISLVHKQFDLLSTVKNLCRNTQGISETTYTTMQQEK